MALELRRGIASALPTGLSGEPLWTTDTKILYIGDGATNHAQCPIGGSISISIVGTLTSGTWHGSTIADAYIASAATWNLKLSSYTMTGTTGTGTIARDYNAALTTGTGVYVADAGGAIANAPNGAWFGMSIVGHQPAGGADYVGQLVINDQAVFFRGGTATSPTAWQQLATNGIHIYTMGVDSINGSTTRDYNNCLVQGTGFYMTDGGGAVSNSPSGMGWFAGSYVTANGTYCSQLVMATGGLFCRGGYVSSPDAWHQVLTDAKLLIKEGTNAAMGLATLVAGVCVVSTTRVTANSRIFLTRQTVAGTVGTSVDVTARTAGTSFTITAAGSVLDTSTVAWMIVEPA